MKHKPIEIWNGNAGTGLDILYKVMQYKETGYKQEWDTGMGHENRIWEWDTGTE